MIIKGQKIKKNNVKNDAKNMELKLFMLTTINKYNIMCYTKYKFMPKIFLYIEKVYFKFPIPLGYI